MSPIFSCSPHWFVKGDLWLILFLWAWHLHKAEVEWNDIPPMVVLEATFVLKSMRSCHVVAELKGWLQTPWNAAPKGTADVLENHISLLSHIWKPVCVPIWNQQLIWPGLLLQVSTMRPTTITIALMISWILCSKNPNLRWLQATPDTRVTLVQNWGATERAKGTSVPKSPVLSKLREGSKKEKLSYQHLLYALCI